MEYHWDNSCFKTNKHIEAVLKRPAHLLASSKSEILCEKSSDRRGVLYPEKNIPNCLLQFNRTSGSEIFISFIYNNLLSINHFNQPKGTVLRLKDETEIMII